MPAAKGLAVGVTIVAAATTGAALAVPHIREASQSARIAFLWNGRLYFMNGDGSAQRRVRLDGGYPAWSPDGRRMVFFVVDARATARLYIAHADGSRRRLLVPVRETRNDHCLDPLWSSDGRKIAYERDCDVDLDSIYVVNQDGSGRRNLTPGNWSLDPAWSPDGWTILFTSVRRHHGSWWLFLVSAAGGPPRRIVGDYPEPYPLGLAPEARWSRDGKSIFFISQQRLFAVSRDGRRFRNLTPPQGKIREFELLPNGRSIAFAAALGDDEGWEIYVMNANGRGLRRLTTNRRYDIEPKWSPDGRKIVFTSERDRNFEICVMNADGSEQTNLSRNPGEDVAPAGSRSAGPARVSASEESCERERGGRVLGQVDQRLNREE